LLNATAGALTDTEEDGINDELVSSYCNFTSLVKDADAISKYKCMAVATAAYLGSDWLAAFACQPSYCFMKGLNSEGTPKVMQFQALISANKPQQHGIQNYPEEDVTTHADTTAYLTILYDTILGLTFNSAGYRSSSFEGLTTGALYTPPPMFAGAGNGVAPGNPT
jgi:hypothetical protein